MTTNELALEIIKRLKIDYPDPMCSLDYGKDYELLFSVRLAAQCTDERVNQIAPRLYKTFPTLESFASADIALLEEIIRPCGFFHIKARDIVACAAMLLTDFGGKVPDTMDELLKLPGVGRKTANLILGDIYHKPAVVTDTHCIRLSNRMGLASGKDPYKVEKQLAAVLPPDEQSDFCHRLVLHGRAVCKARSPKCGLCSLSDICPSSTVRTEKN